MAGTFWALVPPIVAIVLALITKETYSSLFIGIVVGSLFVGGFNLVDSLDTMISDQFDDARLREVFKAYVCGLGDPLNLYIEDLKMADPPFRMEISMATGEPCIFARRKG